MTDPTITSASLAILAQEAPLSGRQHVTQQVRQSEPVRRQLFQALGQWVVVWKRKKYIYPLVTKHGNGKGTIEISDVPIQTSFMGGFRISNVWLLEGNATKASSSEDSEEYQEEKVLIMNKHKLSTHITKHCKTGDPTGYHSRKMIGSGGLSTMWIPKSPWNNPNGPLFGNVYPPLQDIFIKKCRSPMVQS